MNYKSLLYEIQEASSKGPTTDTIIVPSNIRLYTIDLNTREIDAPEYLSVQHEHYAETVYFLVDRYYDNMDLAQTTCVVQYVTNNESYVYAVPFCDVTTYPDKIIIPWCISGSATQYAGTVRYLVRFYMIDEQSVIGDNDSYDPSGAEFSYSLSTVPASSRVMYGLPIDNALDDEEYHIETNTKFFELLNVFSQMIDNGTTYWVDVGDSYDVDNGSEEQEEETDEQGG